MEDSTHSYFRQAKKTPLDFRYPGTNKPQRVKFAEGQEPAGVLKRAKFTIEFLTKLGEVFGQDTEAAVLWGREKRGFPLQRRFRKCRGMVLPTGHVAPPMLVGWPGCFSFSTTRWLE